GVTSRGITYYAHGETPEGWVVRFDNPQWKHNGQVKSCSMNRGFRQLKSCAVVLWNPARIDGLSGATLTSNGIQHMFDFWLGITVWSVPEKVREGALNNG
ncbi:FMN-binding protein, partial [Providencia rettgeri]|nr:FMN-binding protein [Providencia rettgeri]